MKIKLNQIFIVNHPRSCNNRRIGYVVYIKDKHVGLHSGHEVLKVAKERLEKPKSMSMDFTMKDGSKLKVNLSDICSSKMR